MLRLAQMHERAVREQQVDSNGRPRNVGGLRKRGAMSAHGERACDSDVPVHERVADRRVALVQVVCELEERDACLDDDAADAGWYAKLIYFRQAKKDLTDIHPVQ